MLNRLRPRNFIKILVLCFSCHFLHPHPRHAHPAVLSLPTSAPTLVSSHTGKGKGNVYVMNGGLYPGRGPGHKNITLIWALCIQERLSERTLSVSSTPCLTHSDQKASQPCGCYSLKCNLSITFQSFHFRPQIFTWHFPAAAAVNYLLKKRLKWPNCWSYLKMHIKSFSSLCNMFVIRGHILNDFPFFFFLLQTNNLLKAIIY